MGDKINLSEKLATFSEYWSPRTVAQLSGPRECTDERTPVQ